MGTLNKCAYRNCDFEVNAPHDSQLCLFHASIEKKGKIVGEFNDIFLQNTVYPKQHNFEGYIFPGTIDLSRRTFHSANFNNVAFHGDVSFGECKFEGIATFYGAKFSGDADFREIETESHATFVNAEFIKEAYFREAKFGGIANFNKAKFTGECNFGEATFQEKANFVKTIWGGKTIFLSATFKNDLSLLYNEIGGDMNFSYITITNDSVIRFKEPIFKVDKSKEGGRELVMRYDSVQFQPFGAYFEQIRNESENAATNAAVYFLFRNCQLKDVYFTGNDMSLFSFYKSSFDESRFISSNWGVSKERILWVFPFTRRNIMLEEEIFRGSLRNISDGSCTTNLRDKYSIEELNSYDEVAVMYRRMKAALDRSKDYQEASWFYFNEMEMKRLASKESLRDGGLSRRLFSRISIYNLYKILAGYGEKPVWSFIWFSVFATAFSLLHLINGLAFTGDGESHTIYLTNLRGIADVFTAIFYTLSRVLPVAYFRHETLLYTAAGGNWGSILVIANTFSLLLLLIFIGVGLKRHFRRF